MAKVLVDAGADINDPLVAAASIGNVEVAVLLIDAGAAINGAGRWSPLEEALYWGNRGVINLLLERGASVHNLRIAVGLGRTDLIDSFFRSDGGLKPEAGKIEWPFLDPEESNLPLQIKEELHAKISKWHDDPQSIINNAFIYACMHGSLPAARLLLQKGAQIDANPPGFDYSGTGLRVLASLGVQAKLQFKSAA